MTQGELLALIIDEELGLIVESTYVLIDVVEPISTLIKASGDYYFVHVLQDRHVRTTDGKRAYVFEVVLSKTTVEDTIEFLKGEKPIHSFVLDNDTYRIGSISNRIYPKKKVESISEIADRFPKEDFFLTPLLPNKIDTDLVIQELTNLLK